MEDYDKLMVGDQSTDGRLIIADKDRLCYQVKLESKGVFQYCVKLIFNRL